MPGELHESRLLIFQSYRVTMRNPLALLLMRGMCLQSVRSWLRVKAKAPMSVGGDKWYYHAATVDPENEKKKRF